VLTPFRLAAMAMRLEFEIELWCDPPHEQKRAHLVLGKSGLIKFAWGPVA
jgi:hypothetical protein